MNIAELRQEYMRAGLAEAQADPDPLRQFERWFEDAVRAKLPLPNAMTLATIGAGGAATDGKTRILDIQPRGLHQRVAVILGSKNEVERVGSYHPK